MSGPSDRAIESARREGAGEASDRTEAEARAEVAVHAAHDPALGLDRSVCLRDVVEALRSQIPQFEEAVAAEYADAYQQAADFIEREFGGSS